MGRKLTDKGIKKKAWDEFSKFIRLKHCNDEGKLKCVTCSRTFHWTKVQAGHFVNGRHGAVLYNELIVFPQCEYCNVTLNGNKVKYRAFMIKKYGLEQTEKFLNLIHTSPIPIDHESVFQKYRSLNEIWEKKLNQINNV